MCNFANDQEIFIWIQLLWISVLQHLKGQISISFSKKMCYICFIFFQGILIKLYVCVFVFQLLGCVRWHGCSVLCSRPWHPWKNVHELPGSGQLPLQRRLVVVQISNTSVLWQFRTLTFPSYQVTTTGWLTQTMTTMPSPMPAAPKRMMGAVRTVIPLSSPGTPVASLPPSSASSVRSRMISAWPGSSSLCCSLEPANKQRRGN